MNAAGFWRGVALAFVLSAIGAAAFWLLAPFTGTHIAIRLVLLLVASATLLDLLLQGPNRAGRLLVAASWFAICVGLLVFNPPLWLWLGLLAALPWLLRNLGSHARPLPALLDAAVMLIAAAVGMATLRHSGSVGLALWSFLLLQALAASFSTATRTPTASGDRFTHAQRTAEAALQRLYDSSATR
ncbi:MAG: hypothetical protein ACT4NL_05710 [Pseudomarimonas sp.]